MTVSIAHTIDKIQARLTHLRNTIDRAAQCYYYGTELITDSAFDALLAELKTLDSTDPRLTRVGYPVPPSTLQKFKHTTFSGSLDKCDTPEDLAKWHVKVGGGQILAAHKLDGNSLFLYYEKGNLIRAVTRGGDDGIGEDVTANAIRSTGIPTSLPHTLTITIRGESVLSVTNWKKLDPTEHSNPRNIGSGLLRRTEGPGVEQLDYIAFDTDYPIWKTEEQKLEALLALGFTVVHHQKCGTIPQMLDFLDATAKARDTLPYWLDGVVYKVQDLAHAEALGISSGRPRAHTVLKFENEGAETTLLDIAITIGHTGAIIPTAKLKPVKIGGTTISSALLNNYDVITDLDLAIGDECRIEKMKGIIPAITAVVSRPVNRKPIVTPTKCPICGEPVTRRVLTGATSEGRIHECTNPTCPAKSTARIACWIKKLDIKGIGDEVLAAMVEKLNVSTPADLYRIPQSAWADLPIGKGRLGDNRAAAITQQLYDKRTLSLTIFMGSLGIPHLGRRRVQLIREMAPGQMDTLADWRSGKLLTIADRVSMPRTAQAVVAGIEAFSEEIDDLLNFITIADQQPQKKEKTMSKKLDGKVICFTGKIDRVDEDGKRFTRDRMQELVTENGGSCSDGVMSSTTHLVQADPDSKSSKSEKAKKQGVTILAEAEFFKLIGM